MNISINPSYLCNLRCDFCYLTPTQLSDTKRIELDTLDYLLSQFETITHIDLYGGEISALPLDYQTGLIATIRKHYSGQINVNTNLIRISPILYEEGIFPSVSFDGPARERWETVLSNIALLNKPIAVLVLCTPKVLEFGAEMMMEFMRSFNNIVSVEIKPYSANQSNDLGVSYTEFEEYVKQWIEASRITPFLFNFENEERIVDSLYNGYNAFSDDHIYITPNGKYAVLEFDMNDREYFLELDSLSDFRKWTQLEHYRVVNNSYCGQCEFIGRCLTEHYRFVSNVDRSCNGFYSLLKWYDQDEHDA